jgi:hypothetical protein
MALSKVPDIETKQRGFERFIIVISGSGKSICISK